MAQTREFRGTARAKLRHSPGQGVAGCTEYIYHSTSVAKIFDDGVVVLNSGGYRSNTTKLAMNQALNERGLPFSVYQKKGEWYVRDRRNNEDRAFYDNMKLS